MALSSINPVIQLRPGTEGQILKTVGGSAIWQDSEIIKGSHEITGTLGQLEYLIPYVGTISHFQLTQVENSDGGGYYSDFIAKTTAGQGITIEYNVQPPVGQKIKFNYLIIK